MRPRWSRSASRRIRRPHGLTESRPQNQLQAKFSIPFAVATALLRGETGPTAFVDEAITSEAIALAERVTVAVDDGSPPGLPNSGAHG